MKINLLAGTTSKGLSKIMGIKKVNRLVLMWSVIVFACFLLVVGGIFFYFNFKLGVVRGELKSLERAYSSRAREVVAYVRSKQSIE